MPIGHTSQPRDFWQKPGASGDLERHGCEVHMSAGAGDVLDAAELVREPTADVLRVASAISERAS